MTRFDGFIAAPAAGLCAAVAAVMNSSLQRKGAVEAPPGSPPR